jgi:rRNA-processing protein FCF1
MDRIILDTNFLIELVKNKIDLESELDRVTVGDYKVYIIDRTLDELKSLKIVYAKIALKFSERFEKIKTTEDKLVDDLIVDNVDIDTIVGTQDKELKRRLSCRKLVVRSRRYLEIV